jgi:Flp pilus assembly secretin CpaC
LRDGQSFAVAGLLNTMGQEDKAAIPILSQIPFIGDIFACPS